MPAQRFFALCGLCDILVVSSQNHVKVRKAAFRGSLFITREKTIRLRPPPAAPGGSNTVWFRFRARCRAQQCPAHAGPRRVSDRAPSPRGPDAKMPRPRPRSCRNTAPTGRGRPQGHDLAVSGRRIGQHHRRQHQNRHHHRDAELSTASLRRMPRTAAPWPPTPSCLLHV